MTRRRGLGLDFVDALPPDGERRLMLAVLIDAVRVTRTLQKERSTHPLPLVRERELVREMSWFLSPDRSHPFAFECICDALGLNADYIRRCISQPPQNEASKPVRRYASRVQESWIRQQKHGGRLYLQVRRRRKRAVPCGAPRVRSASSLATVS